MTTPTPEAIRKAQHAMMWVKLPFGGNDLMISLDANAAHAAAKLAYDAMAPIIAAQAKAEALREAADALDLPGSNAHGYYSGHADFGYSEAETHAGDWLRARAAAIEAGSE